jgi:hypothetical protein
MRQQDMVMGPSRLGPVSDVHCKIQNRPLVREDTLHQEASTCQTKEHLEIWSWAPKSGPTPRRTGRLTVGRKFNSTPFTFDEAAACQLYLQGNAWKRQE